MTESSDSVVIGEHLSRVTCNAASRCDDGWHLSLLIVLPTG